MTELGLIPLAVLVLAAVVCASAHTVDARLREVCRQLSDLRRALEKEDD